MKTEEQIEARIAEIMSILDLDPDEKTMDWMVHTFRVLQWVLDRKST